MVQSIKNRTKNCIRGNFSEKNLEFVDCKFIKLFPISFQIMAVIRIVAIFQGYRRAPIQEGGGDGKEVGNGGEEGGSNGVLVYEVASKRNGSNL